MSKQKEQKKPGFIGPFFRQFFDLSMSAGSVIGDAIGLFKTFQKIGSVKSFSVHLSEQCLKMFSWAIEIIEIIASALYVRPFSDIQKLYGYTFVIPLSILMFISTVIITTGVPFQLIFILMVLMLGAGFSLIKIHLIIAIVFISVPVVLLILGLILRTLSKWIIRRSFGKVDIKKEDSKHEDSYSESESNAKSNNNKKGNDVLEDSDSNGYEYIDSQIAFSLSFMASFFTFSTVAFPLTFSSTRFTFFSLIIFTSIFIILLIVELILDQFNLNAILYNLLSFAMDLLSLAIIPSVNAYVSVTSPDKNIINSLKNFTKVWDISLGYFVCGFLLPILVSISSIFYDRNNLRDKYRKSFKMFSVNFLYFTEFIDTIKQILYACAAASDKSWVCIGIECFWIVYLIGLRPYKSYSEYCMQTGSSLVSLMGNGFAIGYKNTGTIFSFKTSLIIACISCIPFLVSFYVYFFFEYEPFLKKIQLSDKRIIQKKKGSLICICIPIVFFAYAFSIPKFYIMTFNP